MTVEVIIKNDDGSEYKRYTNVNCIIQPHFDINGRLDGGWIVEDGILKGHADPTGENGQLGENGIN